MGFNRKPTGISQTPCRMQYNTIQQQKSIQHAQCNKIHQLQQLFFCSLSRVTRWNNFLHLLHLVALSMVTVNPVCSHVLSFWPQRDNIVTIRADFQLCPRLRWTQRLAHICAIEIQMQFQCTMEEFSIVETFWVCTWYWVQWKICLLSSIVSMM